MRAESVVLTPEEQARLEREAQWRAWLVAQFQELLGDTRLNPVITRLLGRRRTRRQGAA